MNALAFAELVKNPALLRNYSLSDLQDLAQQHPYASTVYSMIALKAHMEADGNYEHYLNQAAIRIPDRKRLYHLIHSDYDYDTTEVIPQLPEKRVIVEDDFETVISETSKTEITEKVEEVAPLMKEDLVEGKAVVEEPVSKEELNTQHSTPNTEVEEDVELITPDTQETKIEGERELNPQEEELRLNIQLPTPNTQEEELNTPTPTPNTQEIDLPGSDEVVEALGALRHSNNEVRREIEENIVKEARISVPLKEKPAPSNKGEHSFSEWLSLLKGKQSASPDTQEKDTKPYSQPPIFNTQYATPNLQYTPEELTSQPSPPNTQEEEEIEEIITAKQAKASLTADDELVTETLAQIYAMQKKYDKAIRAYQMLSLKYPDKRAYFAEKIDKLKIK